MIMSCNVNFQMTMKYKQIQCIWNKKRFVLNFLHVLSCLKLLEYQLVHKSPASKMQEPKSNHFVHPFFCQAITQMQLVLETSNLKGL